MNVRKTVFLFAYLTSLVLFFCAVFLLLAPPEKEAKPSRGRFEPLQSEQEDTGTKQAEEKAARDRDDSLRSRLVRDKLVDLSSVGEVCIYIYMNGSDLESFFGFASQDLQEILDAGCDPRVHILVQTMGTMQWQGFGIASDHSQRYEIKDHELILLDDSLPQLDCTVPESLSDFLVWGQKLYPAERNILILWDHGGGSVDGFGYDEWRGENESLTLDEMQQALWESGMVFDFIGMDACIMSSIEVCYALYDYCDYCILSEDFESALGWSYGGWISTLASDPAVDTVTLARGLIDDMISVTDRDYTGASSTLALIDERYIPGAWDAWMSFAYENEETLLGVNYSREVERSGRARVSSTLAQFYITDLLALAVSIPSPRTKALVSRLASCVAYYNCSLDNTGLTGLSVTLPYGDNGFYNSLTRVFASVGIDKQYIRWLGNFQTAAAADSYYDYYEFDHGWEGWEDFSYEE
ncbi:MAG: hypothetical protein IK115_14360 [Lachnospiraceae bacterium]|nr:hypothetical protein [Lachnospiraceae bacterium]